MLEYSHNMMVAFQLNHEMIANSFPPLSITIALDLVPWFLFVVSRSGLGFRDSGLRRSQSRDPGIFSGLVIRQDSLVTGVKIGQILLYT